MIEQKRILATSIPGPASQALQARKTAAVAARRQRRPAGLRHARAAAASCVDVDGNQLIDFGSGIAVTTVGNGNQRVVDARHRADRRVHPHLLHGHAVRGVRRGVRGAQRADPGRAREALGAVQLRRRGRRERRQDRPPRHRAAGGRRLRPRLPRPHQPHDGPDREEHALQAPLRAVRRRGLPRADGLPLPLARRRRALRRGGPGDGRRARSTPRWARTTPPPSSSSRSRARAASSCRPTGFLPGLADWCREHGILLIADEIQSGFCRTGDWFACDHEGVVPDLVTAAKGIAGGMPLAAVTGRAELMDAVHAGGLGGTYGGNPVACAAALAAIETMEEEDLAGRAREIGAILTDRLGAARREVRRGRRGARPWRDDRDGAGHRPRHQGARRRR